MHTIDINEICRKFCNMEYHTMQIYKISRLSVIGSNSDNKNSDLSYFLTWKYLFVLLSSQSSDHISLQIVRCNLFNMCCYRRFITQTY